MRSALIFLLFGFAGSLSAQHRSVANPLYTPAVRPPAIGRSPIGAPQLPPGLNGLRGPQQTPGLNGIPSFSNGIYNYGCFGCSPVRGRQSNLLYGGFVPLFSGYAFPSYWDESAAAASVPPPVVDPTAMAITDEVGRLRSEVDQLKMQSAAPNPAGLLPAPAAAPSAPEVNNEPPEPATLIVLRDGRRIETTNYAVMEQTLWNFSAKPVQKLSLSDIDMAASEKANAERGVDFSLSANATN
jgi:hypothetical protein